MADRFPLIVDSSTQRVKELVSGDNLDLTSSGIVNVKNITLPDSSDSTDGRLKFGASTDMMLYHFGGANYFDVTNTLNIRGGTGVTINIKPKNDEEGIIITPNGSVKLYYDNSSKFETTSGGASVTGTFAASTRININNTTTTASDIVHSINTGGSLTTTQRTKADGTIQLGSVNGGSDTANIVLNADGSASFAGGGFALDSDGEITTNVKSQGHIELDSTGSFSSPKIKFFANTGFAEFTGEIKVEGDNTPSGLYSGISKYGSLLIATSSEAVGDARLAIDSGNGNITSIGSATFAARVDAGAITVDSNLTPTSGTSIEAFYGSTGGVIQAYDRDNSNWEPLRVKGSNWTIDLDGTATFAGRVNAGSSTLDNAAVVGSGNHATKGVFQAYHYNNGSVWVAGGADGVTKSEITAAGAATFAGVVDAAGLTPGYITATMPSGETASSWGVITGRSDSSTVTSQIKADGSASFVSGGTTIDSSSGVLVTSSSGAKSQLNGDGFYQIKTDGSTNAATILASGAATFAGDGHFKCNGTAHADMGVQFINDGEVKIYRPTGGGGSVNLISGSAGVGSPSEQFSVKADGTASFNGNVTSKATFLNELQSGYSATGSAYKVFHSSDTFVHILNNGTTTFGNTSGGGSGTGGMQFTPSNGQLDLINTNSGSLITGYNRNSTSQVFTVAANGSMLLGTTTAGEATADNLTIEDSGHCGITLRSGTSSVGTFFFADGTSGDDRFRGLIQYDHSSNFLKFATNAQEKMRIDSSGIAKFQSSGNVIGANSSVSAGTSNRLFYGQHSATAFSGTMSFTVYTNGNVQNTNDSYGQLSDVKLKENIVDAPSQWDDFKAVRFRKYNFKEETGHETHTQLGVIAQELELTSPGLVYEVPDEDNEGNNLGTTTKAVKSSILTKKALVALQEAMNRIETLEAKVAALEAG